MITPKQGTKSPVPKILSIKAWNKGYMSYLDEGRMPDSGLYKMTNAILSQNGTVKPRPGLAKYGKKFADKILGMTEFVETKGNKRSNRLAVVARNKEDERAFLFISEDDGETWQKITGEDFEKDARCNFLQAAGKILITNGEDFSTIYTIETKKLVRQRELPNITEVTATAEGEVGGENVTYYYAVTGVKDGETARSEAGRVQVNKPREEWRGNSTDKGKEYVKIRWKKNNADKFIIYVGETPTSLRYLTVVTNNNDNSSAYQEWIDSGKTLVNPSYLPPNSNSTRGVRAKRAEFIAGRIYMLGDSDDLWKVTYGGQYLDTLFDFSAFSGGWVRLSPGSKEIPVGIKAFRNGRGEAVPMILFSSTNGVGSLKYLQTTPQTVGTQNIMWTQVIQDNGRDGTDAPDAIAVYNNALYYLSKAGFNTTTTKPQMLNILSTDKISDVIKKDVDLLNNNDIEKSLAVEFGGKIYYALPVSSHNLNQIWVLDLVRGGAWNLPFLIDGIEAMLVYGGGDGISRFLIARNGEIFEMNNQQYHTDDNKPFITDISSGAIKFSEDGSMWAYVVSITVNLLRPRGKIDFSVSGKTEDAPQQTLVTFSKEFKPKQSTLGWGSVNGWGNEKGWSEAPKIDNDREGETRISITKDIDEVVNWISYNIKSDTIGTDYEISDVIIQYLNIGAQYEEDE